MAPHEAQAGADRLVVPGFGAPVARLRIHVNKIEWFPNLAGLDEIRSRGLMAREIRMLEFINQITDKEEWDRKVFDEAIVAKWKTEASVSPEHLNGDVYLSEEMYEYCILELQAKAELLKQTGFTSVLDAEISVAKSDSNVSSTLAESLRACVLRLEDVPEPDKDWHPGSGEKVLDLLHPSLFPVAYGLTRVLPVGTVPRDDCIQFSCQGETIDSFESQASHGRTRYGSYQWLPTDVKLTEEGPRISGYINNLHPVAHTDLYDVLESFVAAAIPLWESCLAWLSTSPLTSFSQFDCRRLPVPQGTSDEDYVLPEELTFPQPDDFDGDEWDWEHSDQYRNWWVDHRILEYPEPGEFQGLNGETLHFRESHPSGLQIIFKLANIHLTPDKPEYEGGSWHVEGALNERICATALYYFDQENVTDSYLGFRQLLDVEEITMVPMQGEWESLETFMGVTQNGPGVQLLGKVLTRPGRMIAFPNVTQHQVQPFKLVDPTRPGHRKILAMFLVDPNRRILSTSNVPPQRRDWWSQEVEKIPRFSLLPKEIFNLIIRNVEDFPISLDQAKDMREKLMDERRAIGVEQDEEFAGAIFGFCEH